MQLGKSLLAMVTARILASGRAASSTTLPADQVNFNRLKYRDSWAALLHPDLPRKPWRNTTSGHLVWRDDRTWRYQWKQPRGSEKTPYQLNSPEQPISLRARPVSLTELELPLAEGLSAGQATNTESGARLDGKLLSHSRADAFVGAHLGMHAEPVSPRPMSQDHK